MNNLNPNDYFTQRNNQLYPERACMPTTRAMFYIANKIPYTNVSVINGEKVLQDDDYFMGLFDSAAARLFMTAKYPWAAGMNPNEIHGMYHSWLDQLVCGNRTSDFHENLTFDDYAMLIASGVSIMTSVGWNEYGIPGHAVLFHGLDSSGNLIAADPYGDPATGYKSTKGYTTIYSKSTFMDHVKPLGAEKKWGHVPV